MRLDEDQAVGQAREQAIFGRYILSDKGDFPSYIGASGLSEPPISATYDHPLERPRPLRSARSSLGSCLWMNYTEDI